MNDTPSNEGVEDCIKVHKSNHCTINRLVQVDDFLLFSPPSILVAYPTLGVSSLHL